MVTKKDYEDYLNDLGAADRDLKSSGGRIPDNAKFGTWLRRNDPIAFEVGFGEFQTEQRYRKKRK
jgi:hypothetical protein